MAERNKRLTWHALRLLPHLLGIVLLIWLSVGAYRVLGVVVHGRSVAGSGRSLWSAWHSPDGLDLGSVQRARTRLGYLRRDLDGLARWAAPLSCGLARLSRETLLGRYSVLGCDGLATTSELAAVAWQSLLEMEHALGGEQEAGPEPLGAAITSLALERSRLQSVRPGAARAAEAADGLPGLPLRAQRLVKLSPAAVDGLLLAPQLLGGDTRRIFLVVLQNPDELRPTGGFISSIAALVMEGHRLVSLEYLNSYDIETEGYVMPPAPAPLARYMSAGGLTFRDANWSPDFPTTAQVLNSLYQASREPVDGIIAIDTHLLRWVLSAMGPVWVPQYGVTITGDNLLEMSETFWENPLEGASLAERDFNLLEWLQHRKDFGRDFIQAGRDHLGSISASTWLSLAETLVTGARERHLQVWAPADQLVQQDLQSAGWSGAVADATPDSLMVVDSNVGFNKVDRRIERAIQYDVRVAEGAPRATVTLTYTNTADARLDDCILEARVLDSYQALTERCYWNYVRILVPRGAELVEPPESLYGVDQTIEAGRASFGTLLVVPPGETRSLSFTYALPFQVTCARSTCSYALSVRKQAGTLSTAFSLNADVDPRHLVVSGHSGRLPARWPLTTELRTDRIIRFTWKP